MKIVRFALDLVCPHLDKVAFLLTHPLSSYAAGLTAVILIVTIAVSAMSDYEKLVAFLTALDSGLWSALLLGAGFAGFTFFLLVSSIFTTAYFAAFCWYLEIHF